MLIAIIFISISGVTLIFIMVFCASLILLHITLRIYGITTWDLSKGRRVQDKNKHNSTIVPDIDINSEIDKDTDRGT